MNEVLSFPYFFSQNIADKVEKIQNEKKKDKIFNSSDLDDEIEELDTLILLDFGLENNKFIDYAINIQIPELTNSTKVNIYRRVLVEELKTYSECFEKQFSLIYERIGKYILITLYPDIQNKFSVFELCVLDIKPDQKIKVSENSDSNKELLTKFCVFAHNDMFYQLRDIVHFEESSFFIIKPNSYKYWHPAIAELDLAEVIDQIMSNSGGEE